MERCATTQTLAAEGRVMKRIAVAGLFALLMSVPLVAQGPPQFQPLFNGRDLAGWANINTAPDTWTWRDGLLVNTGKPIGVMCTEKMYENFLLHIEWMHLEPGVTTPDQTAPVR
jgi:hypothetical protein